MFEKGFACVVGDQQDFQDVKDKLNVLKKNV